MSNYKFFQNKAINESYYYKKLDNGLEVVLIPKTGYSKYVAYFTTKFGADNNKFIDKDTNEVITLPYGLAHFLEHKMFEMEGGVDATKLLTELGLDSNAFTSYNQTTYLLSGTKNYDKAINILLDFVQKPFFTDKSVKKEQGIIIQEYHMYMDDPSEKIYLQSLHNTFNAHFKEEVVGNEESIKSINKETLHKAHSMFYHPSNMVLVIAGDIDIDSTFKLVEENQKNKTFGKAPNIEFIYDKEKEEVIKDKQEMILDLPIPQISMTLKLNFKESDPLIRTLKSIKVRLLFDYILGPNSDEYQEMLDKDLFSNLNYSITNDPMAPYLSINAISNKPDELIKYLYNKIESLKDIEISDEFFDMMKKTILASSVLMFNDVEDTVFEITDTYLRGFNLYDYIDRLKELKKEDLNDVRNLIDKKYISYIIAKDSK